MPTQPEQYPAVQIYENNGIDFPRTPPNSSTIAEFPLNPKFPKKYLYAYTFLGASGAGNGFISIDYQFLVNTGSLFSLPFVVNNTTTGVNRWTGGAPNPADPLWPGAMSLFSWSQLGNTIGNTENQIVFTPNVLIAAEPNSTLISPFILNTTADKLKLQSLGFSFASPTFRFWTAVIQLPL